MNKIEFLDKLKKELKDLPYGEVEKISLYYSEIIDDKVDDNVSEEKAVESLGNINKIIKDINNEMSLSSAITNNIKSKYNKSENKTLWIILAILGSPLWVPLVISFIAVIFSIYVVILSFFFVLICLLFSLLIVSVTTFFSGIYFFTLNVSSALLMIGISLLTFGIFNLLCKPLFNLIKMYFKVQKKFTLNMIEKFNGKGSAINE